MSRTVNLNLIQQCHQQASSLCSIENLGEMAHRRLMAPKQGLYDNIQTDFDAAAYVYYLISKLGLAEVRAMFFFKEFATRNLLFSMIETQPAEVTLKNLQNMTKEVGLSPQGLGALSEFIRDYKQMKNSKRRVY